MKRVVIAAAAFAACLAAAQAPAPASPPAMPSAAAESGDNMAELRSQIRSDRRGLIERNLQLTPKEAEKFWPIYDKYQKDLEKILRRQNRAINDYIASEASMTNANAKRIAREILTTEADEQSLKERTMKSVVKVLPEKKAVRFLQLENKIRIIQRYDLAAVMPFVR